MTGGRRRSHHGASRPAAERGSGREPSRDGSRLSASSAPATARRASAAPVHQAVRAALRRRVHRGPRRARLATPPRPRRSKRARPCRAGPSGFTRREAVPVPRASGYAWFALGRGRTRWRAGGGVPAPAGPRRRGAGRVRRPMAETGLAAAHRRPRTRVPRPERKVWPCPLGDVVIGRPAPGSGAPTSPPSRCAAASSASSRRWTGRGGTGPGVAAVEHGGCGLPHRGAGGGAGSARAARRPRPRAGQPVHEPPLHRRPARRRRAGLHGRPRPLDGLNRPAFAGGLSS